MVLETPGVGGARPLFRKVQVVCLEQKITYVAALWLVVAASPLVLSFAVPSPHPPTEGYPT